MEESSRELSLRKGEREQDECEKGGKRAKHGVFFFFFLEKWLNKLLKYIQDNNKVDQLVLFYKINLYYFIVRFYLKNDL